MSYEIKSIDSGDNAFSVFTETDGTLWFQFGTDSGFEGKTSIYYTTGKITATPV